MSSTDILRRKYERVPECTYRDIQGEVVIISPTSGKVHLLNPVASFVWLLLDGGRSCDDLIQEICAEFQVGPDEARADLADFIMELEQADIIKVCE